MASHPQAVNRAIADNPEADKGWQKTVVRNLTEQMVIPSPPIERRQPDNEPVTSPDRSDATGIIQRVSGLTIGELDKTIQELQKVRGFLVSEEERMRREIADYLKLTQATISSTKAMAETLVHLGSAAGAAGK
jgi:hypothetical protein